MEPSTDQDKRNFLKYILGGSTLAWLAAVFYPILAYMKPPPPSEVEVSSVKVGKLNELEDGTIIRFGTKPVILVKNPAGEFRAYGATCTHLDCTVQLRTDLGIVWCACHNGKYDLNGRNVGGPPPRPLDEYRVMVQGDELFVSRKTA
jgi:Rieske Fe-S protein